MCGRALSIGVLEKKRGGRRFAFLVFDTRLEDESELLYGQIDMHKK